LVCTKAKKAKASVPQTANIARSFSSRECGLPATKIATSPRGTRQIQGHMPGPIWLMK